jgi:serine/threonine-protein kinase
MSATPLPNLDDLSVSDARCVEQICTRFEAAWKQAPPRPRLEEFVGSVDSPSAAVVFCELLRLEIAYRVQRDERPTPSEYLERHYGGEALVRAVFAEAGLTRADIDAATQSTVALPHSSANAATVGADGLPAEVPGYAILGVLGHGGMGTVFRARQLSANRTVALKLIRADRLQALASLPERQRWIRRFHWEAEAVANLDHPHVVPLYEVGEHDGRPYFSMKLVEGGTLASQVKRFAADPRAAAALLAKVARALHHAHQRQILHRDLKPHNILLDVHGEPLITDFGLSCRIETAPASDSPRDAIMGTPAYMAPEQVQADRGLSTAVDVYGLGALLYYVLTGRPPHRGASTYQTLTDVLSAEPPPPRSLNAKADRDLDAICLKCLRKAPAERYGSAQEVADELERWLRDEPIRARRTGPVERIRKWIRRKPARAVTVALGLLIVAVAGLFAWQAHVARAQLLEVVIEKAVLAAMAGDFDQADGAIQEAADHGASTAQVEMLHGMVAYHRGREQDAIKHLELAVRLSPAAHGATARGLLAMAYSDLGRVDAQERVLQELESIEPVAHTDFLYKGTAISQWDPEEGVALLDQAVHRKPLSPVALLLRAEARTALAQDRGDVDLADAALQDMRMAGDLLGADDAVARWDSAWFNLVLAGVYESKSREDRFHAVRDQARRDAEALKAHSRRATGLQVRMSYFWYHGQRDEKHAVLLESRERAVDTDSPAVGLMHATILHWRDRPGDLDEAERVLAAHRGNAHCSLLRCYVLARRDGRRAALDAYAKIAHKELAGYHRLCSYGLLLFLGEKERAQREARADRQRGMVFARRRKDFFEAMLNYCAGDLSGAGLRDAASRSGSRWNQCLAHHFIGLSRLGEGKRKDAAEEFDNVIEMRILGWEFYDLTVALREHMDKAAAGRR